MRISDWSSDVCSSDLKAQYPDADQRRRLYKTSLTPRSAKLLLDRAEAIRVKLSQGRDYARWTAEEQFAFIRDVLAFLSEIPVFAIETKLGRKKNFDDWRSEEHTSELQSLMRISYAVFCLKKNKNT